MESFTIEFVWNACAQLFPDNTLSSLQTFNQSNWTWKIIGRLQFQKFPTHQCTKMLRREKLCFWQVFFKVGQNSIIWDLVLTLPLRIFLKSWTLSFKTNTITAKIVSPLKCLEERKKLRFTLQKNNQVLHSLVRIWDTFSEVMLVLNLE